MIIFPHPMKQARSLLYRRSYPRVLCYGLHTDSTHRAITTNANASNPSSFKPVISSSLHSEPSKHSLSLLPIGVLIRSYMIATLSSSPLLLRSSLSLLSKFANSRSPLLSTDHNFFLRYLLKKTIYVHFCAGEKTKEIDSTVSNLKRMGYHGVILAYAKEILVEGEKVLCGSSEDESAAVDVEAWRRGNLETIKLAKRGDFVAIKFTGAGNHVVQQLICGALPGKTIENAMTQICELAKARGVGLLIDAEQSVVQGGIDLWTLQFQTRYNTITAGKSIVYGTYQAYLRSTPTKLAQHIAVAQENGFILGVKLVRGAYMGSDSRQIFWSSKEDTDSTYDGIVKALVQKQYNSVLVPVPNFEDKAFPEINLVVATHNRTSVQNALKVIREQNAKGNLRNGIAFGQLMGMADEISSELVLAAKATKGAEASNIRVYKYLPWGTVSECLKYLVRRAEENQHAVERAKDGQSALRAELARRIFRWT